MVGPRKSREKIETWPTNITEEFLLILQGYFAANGTTNFKPSIWEEISEKLYEKCEINFGGEKCRQKKNRIHRLYRNFKELINHTGVTWNPNTNKIEADETVWNSVSV